MKENADMLFKLLQINLLQSCWNLRGTCRHFLTGKKMRLWDVTWRNGIWICVAFCFEFWTFNLQRPYMLKWFGLCTWDAFCTNLTIGRLREILKIFCHIISILWPLHIFPLFSEVEFFFPEVTMYMSLWILRELHAHLITQPSKQTKHIILYHSYLFFFTKYK